MGDAHAFGHRKKKQEPSTLTQSNFGDMNNNKIERFNGEVRDREKTLRGLKKNDTIMLSGYHLS